MLILSLTLMVFGIALYHNFKYKLSGDMNDLLRSRANGIVESIDTYWETERLESNKGFAREHFSKQDNINFTKIAQRWVGDKDTDPFFVDFIVRIFDVNGKLIAASKNIPVVGLNPQFLKDFQRGSSHFEDIRVESIAFKSNVLRIFTIPVIENNKVSYIVQVASPLERMYLALNNLSLLLSLLLPATVLLTGLSGIFLVKLTLKPVNEMIDTIHQITAENLNLRINIPQSKDEIQALAITFNDMIIRLDEAFRSQRQFMEDISHELKTPLSILKGELEVTLKKIRSAKEYETTLQSSLEEIDRLTRIVNDLLVLARFDTKTVALEIMPIHLNDLINNVINDLRFLAEKKTIKLDFNDECIYSVNADREQLKRLFLNLLDNAIKYTPQEGKISINVFQEGGGLKVDIVDTGVGISQKEIPRIFDRFYRVDKSRSSFGFGLGLSISKSVALAHGGDITVRPNDPQGSVFSVILPIRNL